MLSTLVAGYDSSSAEPTASGLSELVRGQPARSMSLVGALNALRRNEVARPADDVMGLDSAPLPARPKPAPRPLVYQAELDAQAAADARDKAEMKVRLRAKTHTAAAQREWETAKRLAAAETELNQWR
jgi:hypothetical protein